uniref:Uncharacterized protein n=1 Tax=Bubo bubo TaxID=30461 RepID=A0A8C0I7N6_BUBBB
RSCPQRGRTGTRSGGWDSARSPLLGGTARDLPLPPHPGLQLLDLLLAPFESNLFRFVQAHLQVLDSLLHVLLHPLQVRVSFHLLPQPDGLILGSGLCIQRGLHGVHGTLVVAPAGGMLHQPRPPRDTHSGAALSGP